jgi:hypothetical protein
MFRRQKKDSPLVERCYCILDSLYDIERSIVLLSDTGVNVALVILRNEKMQLEEEWEILSPYFHRELTEG